MASSGEAVAGDREEAEAEEAGGEGSADEEMGDASEEAQEEEAEVEADDAAEESSLHCGGCREHARAALRPASSARVTCHVHGTCLTAIAVCCYMRAAAIRGASQ